MTHITWDAEGYRIVDGIRMEHDGMTKTTRTFNTGATRDQDATKPDYEGFLSPLVITRFGEYMHKHRHLTDGTLRDSDNWQKGIPLTAYIKSGFRHFMDWWKWHRCEDDVKGCITEGIEEALCAVIFNAQGYLHELLKRKDFMDGYNVTDTDLPVVKDKVRWEREEQMDPVPIAGEEVNFDATPATVSMNDEDWDAFRSQDVVTVNEEVHEYTPGPHSPDTFKN